MANATIDEAAEYWHVSTKTIRRWIAQGRLQAERIGRRLIRVKMDSLRNLGAPIGEANHIE